MGIKLGVTGGIGSGKSTVCKVFNVLGVAVFSADEEARKIMDSEPDVIEKVNRIAGKDMYDQGTLNRQELAAIIFNNKDLLNQINHLIHPAVLKSFLKWASDQVSDYVILESALLYESGSWKHLDKVATVSAPLDERIMRVMKRNGFTREQVLERIRNQGDDEENIKKSDYIIHNSDCDMIIPVIINIHKELMSLVSKRK